MDAHIDKTVEQVGADASADQKARPAAIAKADERLAGMVATYLAPHGFEVRHAATAQAGLAVLRQAGDGIALILLDLILPDADGLDVCLGRGPAVDAGRGRGRR